MGFFLFFFLNPLLRMIAAIPSSALEECGRPGFSPCLGKTPWRRERLPAPVFWPGEFHGLYSPWGHKESDTTEQLSLSLHIRENNLKKNILGWPKCSFEFFCLHACVCVCACT